MKMLGKLLQISGFLGFLGAGAFAFITMFSALMLNDWLGNLGDLAVSAMVTGLFWYLRWLGFRIQSYADMQRRTESETPRVPQSPGSVRGIFVAWNSLQWWQRGLISLAVVVATFFFLFGFVAQLMGIDYNAVP